MRGSATSRGRARPGIPLRPASLAPHASTTKIDSSELRNPSAIYTQAEILAQQHQPPQPTTQKTTAQHGLPPSNISQTLARIHDLAPHATGSSSSLYRTVLKTPMLTQLYMHGSFSSNAPDVLRQFTAELRFFQTVRRHRNIVAFVGSLEGVGMLLEYVDGETLWKYLGKGYPMSVRADWFNQILLGLTHIHSFGLGHNDLCSLNVVVTIPTLAPHSSSASTKYIVKLLDFGRSTVEPRPPPVPSALAALRNTQNNLFRQRHPVTWEEKERERKEREKDLIFPGTRPFASPEIMRAWTLSDAGGANAAKMAEEDEEDDSEEDDDADTESNAAPMHEDEDYSVYSAPPTLPLPLSTPAYARQDDLMQQQTAALHIGRSPLRSRLPILALTDNTHAPPISTPSPSNDTHVPPSCIPLTHNTQTTRAYPSPTSSPSHSEPSSPLNNPFPHDDDADIVPAEVLSSSRRRHRERRSRSRSRWESMSVNTRSTSPHIPSRPRSKSRRRSRRTERIRKEIEAIHANDPHPLSTLLGDTYSLGVMALCLERDVLVDVIPHVQMREQWQPLDTNDPPNRFAFPLPSSQMAVAFFDDRFAAKRTSVDPRGMMSATATSLIERYMRPVRQRQRCSKDDALDIDAIKEVEREWNFRGGEMNATPVAPSREHVARNKGPPLPEAIPEYDFIMDDGGG